MPKDVIGKVLDGLMGGWVTMRDIQDLESVNAESALRMADAGKIVMDRAKKTNDDDEIVEFLPKVVQGGSSKFRTACRCCLRSSTSTPPDWRRPFRKRL